MNNWSYDDPEKVVTITAASLFEESVCDLLSNVTFCCCENGFPCCWHNSLKDPEDELLLFALKQAEIKFRLLLF